MAKPYKKKAIKKNRHLSKVPFKRLDLFIIVISLVILYLPGFKGEMILDDFRNIAENEYITNPWDGQFLYKVPDNSGFSGRPFIQWSFAINRIILGDNIASYHFGNLLFHILNTILIYLLVSVTLRKAGRRDKPREYERFIPLATALLWAVNPIHTHSVTYIVQRAEIQMATGLLAALYFAIRNFDSIKSKKYALMSIASSFFSVGTKEVGAVIPLLIFFYHWTFYEGSFKVLIRKNILLYSGLLLSWLFFILLTTGSQSWDDTAFDSISHFDYLMVQSVIFFYYIGAFLYPVIHPFDLSWDYFPSALVGGFFVMAILFIIIFALRAVYRKKWYGWLLIAIPLILAPTSSLIPLPDIIFIHRYYLPSAFLLAILVVFIAYSIMNLARSKAFTFSTGKLLSALFVAFFVFYSALTFQRNQLHQSSKAVWSDTLEKDPNNARAANNLGEIYLERGKAEEALKYFRIAQENYRRKEFLPAIKYNLGNCYYDLGDYKMANECFTEAIKLKEDYWSAYVNRGVTLIALGRYHDASKDQEYALQYVKNDPNLYVQYIYSLVKLNRIDEARNTVYLAAREGVALPGDFLKEMNLNE